MKISIIRFTSHRGGDVIGVDIEIADARNTESVTFKILALHYAAMRLQAGEISVYDYDMIEKASHVCEAYLTGLNILSFGSNTERTLVLKLRRRGIDSEIASEAAGMLRDRGYINEDEDMRREVERCIRKGWGSRRIIAFLHQKGYDDESIAAADDEFENVDFGKLCLKVLRKKCEVLPRDPGERRKLVASLSRYGYSMNEIRFAMENF